MKRYLRVMLVVVVGLFAAPSWLAPRAADPAPPTQDESKEKAAKKGKKDGKKEPGEKGGTAGGK